MPRMFSRMVPWLKWSLMEAPPEGSRDGISTSVPGCAVPESISAADVRIFSTLPGS